MTRQRWEQLAQQLVVVESNRVSPEGGRVFRRRGEGEVGRQRGAPPRLFELHGQAQCRDAPQRHLVSIPWSPAACSVRLFWPPQYFSVSFCSQAQAAIDASTVGFKAAPGWKAEIIAQPPEVRWPSVVETAPDGRIFVAEDIMDMPGPGNKPVDRILCIHPDGHINVFADNLYAVFGLRYIDGKLFVHHTPKLSVFTDDNGVGKDPQGPDRLRQSASVGSAARSTITFPSNLRLAMDNYLYISTGDKGIFGAQEQCRRPHRRDSWRRRPAHPARRDRHGGLLHRHAQSPGPGHQQRR